MLLSNTAIFTLKKIFVTFFTHTQCAIKASVESQRELEADRWISFPVIVAMLCASYSFHRLSEIQEVLVLFASRQKEGPQKNISETLDFCGAQYTVRKSYHITALQLQQTNNTLV